MNRLPGYLSNSDVIQLHNFIFPLPSLVHVAALPIATNGNALIDTVGVAGNDVILAGDSVS